MPPVKPLAFVSRTIANKEALLSRPPPAPPRSMFVAFCLMLKHYLRYILRHLTPPDNEPDDILSSPANATPFPTTDVPKPIAPTRSIPKTPREISEAECMTAQDRGLGNPLPPNEALALLLRSPPNLSSNPQDPLLVQFQHMFCKERAHAIY